jgi:hypothetical protein
MSRSTSGPEPSQLQTTADLRIDDKSVLKLLKVCQSLAAHRARAAFQQYLVRLDLTLNNEINGQATDEGKLGFVRFQKQLRHEREKLERYFCGCLAEGFVKFRRQKLNTTIAKNIGSASQLARLGKDLLQESIAISAITQRADVYYADSLWALNRRFSVLNRGEKISEESNPAAPIQLCDCLRRTLKLLSVDATGRVIAYQVFDEYMFSFAGSLMLDMNEYLKSQGILRHLRYRIPSQAAPESGLRAMPAVDEIIGPVAAPEVESFQLQPQSDLKASSFSVPQALEVLGNLPVQSDVQKGNQLQTIELVGSLFKCILGDKHQADTVKSLLNYLHTPFLKLAFADPAFFEQTQHPARLLLEKMAEAGKRWVRNDGSAQFGIYLKIKEIVHKIVRDPENDLRVVAQLLFEFSSYTKDILRRQELLEKRATEKIRGEEKLQAVKSRVIEEVRARTAGRELPSAILLLLLQPWSDYLSFTQLRYGPDSDPWHESLMTMDDIIWCIEPRHGERDRQRQMALQKSIPQALKSGLEAIDYDRGKTSQLIESIGSVIDQVIERKSVELAPAPMRDELERRAAEKVGSGRGTERESLTAEEARIVDNLKMIEFGTWFEFENDKRLKVAWYNNRTSHYMLVDQMGKRTAMMSDVDMARSMIAGRARVISGSSKSFFDRTLETIRT